MDPVEHLLSFPVTRPFGDLSFPQYGPHTGVDLGLPEGTPVYAIGAGVCTVDDDDPAFDAGSPATWSGIQVTYRLASDGASITCAHLRVNTVVQGAALSAGQRIGESGHTGAATGPHLHLEIRDITGTLIDPIPYLEEIMDQYVTVAVLEEYKAALQKQLDENYAKKGDAPTPHSHSGTVSVT